MAFAVVVCVHMFQRAFVLSVDDTHTYSASTFYFVRVYKNEAVNCHVKLWQ